MSALILAISGNASRLSWSSSYNVCLYSLAERYSIGVQSINVVNECLQF